MFCFQSKYPRAQQRVVRGSISSWSFCRTLPAMSTAEEGVRESLLTSIIRNLGSRIHVHGLFSPEIQSLTFQYKVTTSYIKVAAVVPSKNGSNDYGEQNMHELWLSRVRKLARPCTNSTCFLPSLFPLVADHLLLITTCYRYLYMLAIKKYQVEKSRTWNLQSPKGVASSSNDLRFILVDGS